MGELRVFQRVPFIGRYGSGPLLFEQWIPEDYASKINIERDGMLLTVFADRQCVARQSREITDELLNKWRNIAVNALRVEVSVPDVPEDLGAFIVEKEKWPQGEDIINSPDPVTRQLAHQYAALGRRVMLAVLDVTNRAVSWAYAERGIHWLVARENTASRVSSNNVEFGACATFGGSSSIRWCPPVRDEPIEVSAELDKCLSRAQWRDLADFIQSNRRADAIGEILANARSLLEDGHARSAVVEAVSALEAATNRFGQTPKPEALRDDRLYSDASLTSHLKHLGFTATVEHLLPLLLPPALLTADLLSRVSAAIRCRQNILHNQQRELGLEEARTHVAAASALVRVLQRATAAS